jgi:hypothetical protein
MKEKDKIYELFRKNEHKLAERPPTSAWDRLDNRLDNHYRKRRHSHSWLRYGGMVAAVLLFTVTASVLMIQTQKPEKAQFVTTDVESSLEDMPVAEDASSYLRIVQYQEEYKREFGDRVVEDAQSGKHLRIKGRNDDSHTNEVYDQPIANNDLQEERAAPAKERAAKKRNNLSGIVDRFFGRDDNNTDAAAAEEPIAMADIEAEEAKSPADDAADEVLATDALMDSPTKMDKEEAKAIFDKKKDTASFPGGGGNGQPNGVGSASKPSSNRYVAIQPSVATAPPSAAVIAKEELAESPTIVQEEYVEYALDEDMAVNGNANGMAADGKAKADADYSLNIFGWIEGTWSENIGGNESKEVWKRVNAHTLRGKGYLKVDGKTVFSEKMEIRKAQGDIFMVIKLDESRGRVSYRLKSYDGQMAVFENQHIDFPSQLILQKHSSNNFSTTLQNGAFTLDLEQKNYIQNRNQILNQKITRNLQRMK